MVIATVLALVLANPVGGSVTVGFDVGANPFEGGRHRGVDLEAGAGAEVRAACSGRVVVAGRVGSSGRLVTVRCGRWRVTHMPMAAIDVRAGAIVARGARLGTVGRSNDHAGLHLGVRREGRRFRYVDPLRFLFDTTTTPPTAIPHGAPRTPNRPQPTATPHRAPRTANRRLPTAVPHRAPRIEHSRLPATRPATRPQPAAQSIAPVAVERRTRNDGLAPWPAWAGLTLVLAGVGLRVRARVGQGRGWAAPVLRRPVR
jgi:hypothetical protein